MTTEDPIKLELEIVAEYTTDDGISQMKSNLWEELNDSHHVQSVKQITLGDAPSGSKIGEVVTLGSLAVAILPTAVPSLITLVQGWVERGRGGRTVKFKYDGLEYEGSREDLEKLLERIEKGKKKKKK